MFLRDPVPLKLPQRVLPGIIDRDGTAVVRVALVGETPMVVGRSFRGSATAIINLAIDAMVHYKQEHRGKVDHSSHVVT